MTKYRVRLTRTTTVVAYFYSELKDAQARRDWVAANREDLFVLGEVSGEVESDQITNQWPMQIDESDNQKS